MKNNILIIGSTGKLGSKLLNYTHKENIIVNTITCYSNKKKLLHQSKKFKVNKSFILSIPSDVNKFLNLISLSKFSIVYFLDYGSSSLIYLDQILKNNSGCTIAIANKEMIVAGGHLLRKKILRLLCLNNLIIKS